MPSITTERQRTMMGELDAFARDRFGADAFSQRFERTNIRRNVSALGAEGYLGLSMPVSVGGRGLPYLDTMLAIETLAHVCPATAETALMSMCGPAMFIARWGTDEQRERFVAPVVAGTRSCWVSLTEDAAGTALTDLSTSAEMRDGVCVVNGHKRPATRGLEGDYYLVFVRFGEGSSGIGAVLVDVGTPGFTLSEPRTWMGGSSWCELDLDDVEVPEADVLPVPGISALLESYSVERCAAGAFVIGIAQLAIDLAVDYARERRQFGRPIAEFQMVQGRLADMFLAHEQARLLLYEAVAAVDDGEQRGRMLTSAAKVATTDAACRIIESAMEIHGHLGVTIDRSPLEWLYRLIRGYTIAGGTNDIHRSMIAAAMTGMRFDHRP